MVLFLVTFEAKLWICWTRFPSVLKFRTHHFVLQALQFCSIGLLLLKKLLRPVWWFWRGAWRRITCTATPIQPAKRTAFHCMMIATSLRWMIHLALVVWFKLFSSSGFRMRTVLCHQDWKKMRTQQTIDVNRLKIERTKHTCQAMADCKTKTEFYTSHVTWNSPHICTQTPSCEWEKGCLVSRPATLTCSRRYGLQA